VDLQRNRFGRATTRINDVLRHSACLRPSLLCRLARIAQEIELANKFENMGAQMVREAASKTSSVTGDGTTTATILARLVVGHVDLDTQSRAVRCLNLDHSKRSNTVA
jgi:hypothetical protein